VEARVGRLGARPWWINFVNRCHVGQWRAAFGATAPHPDGTAYAVLDWHRSVGALPVGIRAFGDSASTMRFVSIAYRGQASSVAIGVKKEHGHSVVEGQKSPGGVGGGGGKGGVWWGGGGG